MQIGSRFTLLADSIAQLLSQGLRGGMKLNEVSRLELDLATCQIYLYRLAKLVGSAYTFPGQDGQHTS